MNRQADIKIGLDQRTKASSCWGSFSMLTWRLLFVCTPYFIRILVPFGALSLEIVIRVQILNSIQIDPPGGGLRNYNKASLSSSTLQLSPWGLAASHWLLTERYNKLVFYDNKAKNKNKNVSSQNPHNSSELSSFVSGLIQRHSENKLAFTHPAYCLSLVFREERGHFFNGETSRLSRMNEIQRKCSF